MLEDMIETELSNRCYRRPTKRMALKIAQILCRRDARPYDLFRVQLLLEELEHRVARAKV